MMPADDTLSATDRARLRQMRTELKAMLSVMDFTVELFTATATAYRSRTGLELSIADPAANLTEQDKLRALELFRAARSQVGKV
jgi:hypothetical protein